MMSGQPANNETKAKNNFKETFRDWLVALVLISVFLLPSFAIKQSLPEVRLEDFLLPIAAGYLLLTRSIRKDFLLAFTLFFSLYIFFTIVINGRLSQYRDYFEICKMLKFALFYVLFLNMDWSSKLFKLLLPLFGCIVVFNLFQYFNILNFNKIVEPFYAESIQLDTFGLNSLGQPDTKRLLGTMGNPNNNGVVWIFFACLFFIGLNHSKWTHYVLFLAAFVGMSACQSRTTFISFIVVYVVSLVVKKSTLKQKLTLTGLVLFIFTVFYLTADAHYIGSLSDTQVLKTHSVKGRLEIWSDLFKMILDKPFFGHAPFKEYFYDNNLYAESEYVLMAWRYGFVGIIIMLAWLYIPLNNGWKKHCSDMALNQALFIVALAINAATNTPFQEPRILVMFALSCAVIAGLKNNTPINAQVAVSGK